MEIQWFPGHMAKAIKQLKEFLKHADAVIEVADARIPGSSRNPELRAFAGKRPVILALNKPDLADPEATKAWIGYFSRQGQPCVAVNGTTGEGIAELTRALSAVVTRAEARRPAGRPVRALIVGIPNVGKSSIINRLARKAGARTGDKPGLTRGVMWIKLGGGIELLDTPGLMWPKIEEPGVGLKLAFTGAIDERVLDVIEVAWRLISRVEAEKPGAVTDRFQLDASALAGAGGHEAGGDRLDEGPEATREAWALGLLRAIGQRRGCLVSGGEVDVEKAAGILLKEFRDGRMGRLTMEWPPSAPLASDDGPNP